MANINLKKDYQDGQVLYGSDLNANNDVTEQGVNDNYRLILELQQDKADNSDVLEDVENLQNQINNKVDSSTFNTTISELETQLDTKVDKEEGKGLSSNDYTDAEKEKLASLENYDDTEIKEALSGKADKTEIPKKLSQLENDENFVDETYVNNVIDNLELPVASETVLGGIKVGDNLTIESDGTLNATGGGGITDIPVATADTLGGIKVGNGLSITVDGILSVLGGGTGSGVIYIQGGSSSSNAYDIAQLRSMTGNIFVITGYFAMKGSWGSFSPRLNEDSVSIIFKYFNGYNSTYDFLVLYHNAFVNVPMMAFMNVPSGTITMVSYTENKLNDIIKLPVASETVLGGIKVGDNLTIESDGTLNAKAGGTKTYTEQPVPPYNVGDLWTNGEELYVCQTAKIDGEDFSLMDWKPTTNYVSQITNINQIVDGVLTDINDLNTSYNTLDTNLKNNYTPTTQIDAKNEEQDAAIQETNEKITDLENKIENQTQLGYLLFTKGEFEGESSTDIYWVGD